VIDGHMTIMFFFFFFLIIKTRFYLTSKDYTIRSHNPTERETEPYIEDRKSDIRHGQRPYNEGSKTIQQKNNIKFNNKDNYNNNNNNNKHHNSSNTNRHKT
jgi:hypothetical protein